MRANTLDGSDSFDKMRNILEKVRKCDYDQVKLDAQAIDDVQKAVDLYGGTFRYGVNALMPVGIELPSVAEASAALRKAAGCDTYNQGK